MRKVLGKELKVGDLIKRGLILEINTRMEFFQGKPNFMYVDINDAYFGPLIGELDYEDEYTIVHEVGSAGYKETLTRMARENMDHARDKMKDAVRILAILDEDEVKSKS